MWLMENQLHNRYRSGFQWQYIVLIENFTLYLHTIVIYLHSNVVNISASWDCKVLAVYHVSNHTFIIHRAKEHTCFYRYCNNRNTEWMQVWNAFCKISFNLLTKKGKPKLLSVLISTYFGPSLPKAKVQSANKYLPLLSALQAESRHRTTSYD